jgi:carbon storage regulator
VLRLLGRERGADEIVMGTVERRDGLIHATAMLVLTRKKDEKIVIGDTITLMIIEIRGDKVRLGIEAPKEVPVHREEVYEAIRREREQEQAKSDTAVVET